MGDQGRSVPGVARSPYLTVLSHKTCNVRYCGSDPTINEEDGSKDNKMATERAQNLQDAFLNHVRKNKIPLTIFLINGVKLQGVVSWFDNFCVLLKRDGHAQLVYKHAISTIMPNAPVHLMDGEPADTPPS
jgi:host factor-I protein